MNEEPTDNEIEQPSLDGILDRLSNKDMIGGRHQLRSMLFTKLKDRLDSLNSVSAPINSQQDEQTIEEKEASSSD